MKFNVVDYKLCYIRGEWAYFTTQELDKQWGDDWNDAPYEHNAGSPYWYSDHDKAQGRDEWGIIMIAFNVAMETPAQMVNSNSRYSVEDINHKHIAWLTPDTWGNKHGKPIFAGVNPLEFQRLITENGGDIYVRPDTAYLFTPSAKVEMITK